MSWMLEKRGEASLEDAGAPKTSRLFVVISDPVKGQRDLQVRADGFSAKYKAPSSQDRQPVRREPACWLSS